MIRVSTLCALVAIASPASAQGVASGVDALFDLLCGRSVHYYDEGGNQIEYTAGDGSAFLWHHDNPNVIVGTWGVYDTDGVGPQVCFEYPASSFGPLDPGGLHCWTETRLFETVVQGGVFAGDRYGLRDGEPPYPLPEHPFVELESFDAEFPELPPEPLCGLPIS